MDLNRATILGRLSQDPEARTTTTGKNVTAFSVATSNVWIDAATKEKKQTTEFHNIVAWGRLGEIVAQYLKKGRQVYIEGRIQTRSWEGQDGTKKYKTEIVAENVILLDGRGTAQAASGVYSTQPAVSEVRYEPASPADKPAATPPANPDTEEISVEDIPF